MNALTIQGRDYQVAPMTSEEFDLGVVLCTKHRALRLSGDTEGLAFMQATQELLAFMVDSIIASIRRADPNVPVEAVKKTSMEEIISTWERLLHMTLASHSGGVN